MGREKTCRSLIEGSAQRSQNHLREQMEQPFKLRGSWLTLVSRIEWLSHLLTQVVLTSLPVLWCFQDVEASRY